MLHYGSWHWAGQASQLKLITDWHDNTGVARTPDSRKFKLWWNLDFDESEALCFVLFFLFCLFCFFFIIFIFNPSVIGPGIPAPPSLIGRGGGVFCLSEESQLVCNNTPPPLPPPITEGEGRGREAFKGSTHSRTFYIVSLLIIVWWSTIVLEDVPCQLKNTTFLFLTACLLCFFHRGVNSVCDMYVCIWVSMWCYFYTPVSMCKCVFVCVSFHLRKRLHLGPWLGTSR